MKVYRIRADPAYLSLAASSGVGPGTGPLVFDGTPTEADQVPLSAIIGGPALPPGDLCYVEHGAIAAAPHAYAVVGPFFETAGEGLPLIVRGVEYILLNVLECTNCLDRARSRGGSEQGRDGAAHLSRYVFHDKRFSESSIFKIPETCEREVLVLDRCGDPETDFNAAVEEFRLSGIAFEEIWASDSTPG